MQLTKPIQFIYEESIIFREPKIDKHGNKSIKILTKYPNNKTGPLVIETPFLFSFGVNERRSQTPQSKLLKGGVISSKEIVGYTLPVCLWGKDEKPTSEQNDFYGCLVEIQELCRKHIADVYKDKVSERLSELLFYKETTDKKGCKISERQER